MKLLALDQASKITGYAVFFDGKLQTYGKIDLKDDNIGIRLNKLKKELIKLIMDYDIDYIAFEDIYMDGQRVNNVQTFKVLAEVFGVCYELFTELEIPCEAVLAGTWKSTLGIKGKTRTEQKRGAQQYVQSRFNIKVTQDVADALCIGEHIIKSNDVFHWDD